MGTVGAAEVKLSGPTCRVYAGQALFQRGAATAANPHPVALVSVPLVSGITQSTENDAQYVGVLRLNFTRATAGTLSADYNEAVIQPELPAASNSRFEKYSAVWTPSSASLKVSFDIIFTGACIVPVTALFHATP